MVDLSVYDRITNVDKEREKNRLANLQENVLLQKMNNQSLSAGKLPAPLQLANEYEKRLSMGDIEGANNLAMFAKTQDKNVYMDAEGIIRERAGIGQALGSIGQQTKYGEQTGKLQADLQLAPRVGMETKFAEQSGTQRAKDMFEPTRAGNIAQQKIEAQSRAEATNLLGELEANMPKLQAVREKLSDLGRKATYTKVGRLRDTILRETGQDMSEGGIARAEYISRVDNEVLPLLRQTFGAAFTEAEGQRLSQTLGDPDASPEEKDARLNAFIEQKIEQVKSLQRQLGQPQQSLYERSEQQFNSRKPKPRLVYNPATGELE